MKFTIYSAKYFEELETYQHYHEFLEKIGKVEYVTDIESGNPFIYLEVNSLEDLVKIIDEIGLSFKICKSYVSGRPYDLWLIDGYLE